MTRYPAKHNGLGTESRKRPGARICIYGDPGGHSMNPCREGDTVEDEDQYKEELETWHTAWL
jgi:hypothetical protein